ncbi:MAG: ribose transport system substrate-binding protein [Pseudonocardiales bacterium]|nr:ribose transport system substrate-binding protein [Pseudonocardiales bacterium]
MAQWKVRRRLAAAAVAAALSIGLTACSSTGSAPGGAAAKPLAKEDIVLVASVINTTNPYMASMIEGAQALSAKLGVPLKIVDSQGSSQTEISQIQSIIAQGKKVVLMVNTVASSDAPPIVNAVKAAGGYVVIWWNKPDNLEPWTVGNNFVAFQKYSGVDSGRCNGKSIGDALGADGGGVVMLPGVQDSTTSQTRVAGFKDALKAYPAVKVLEERPANWDQQKGFGETQTMLAKYGDQVKAIWAADDAMMLGAIEAVKQANRPDIKFASDGIYPPTIDYIKQGVPVVGETFHRGYMAASIGLYTAYLAATGALDPSTMPQEQRDSLFKLACVTPQNYDQYTKYDSNIPGWVDTLVANGPFKTEPTPLVGQGPEKLP